MASLCGTASTPYTVHYTCENTLGYISRTSLVFTSYRDTLAAYMRWGTRFKHVGCSHGFLPCDDDQHSLANLLLRQQPMRCMASEGTLVFHTWVL